MRNGGSLSRRVYTGRRPGTGETARNVSPRVLWLSVVVAVASLNGCSVGSFVPGGPHRLANGQLEALVRRSAQANSIDPKLVSAVIDVESHGDPAAISRVGAQGLMQLMPGTAAQYGVFNAFDPAQNVAAGAHYLHDLLRRYNGNERLAVAAYNAGPGAVDAAHGIPAFAETRTYVDRVVAALR
jgi:soluble lytic murein transglycosylase-like protein